MKNIKELQTTLKVPVFWHFRDLFPVTGGCHYAWNCTGYKVNCTNCPAILEEKYKFWAGKTHTKKLEELKDTKINVIAGTDWLFQKINESSLFNDLPMHKIMNGIDEKVFDFVDKIIAKQKFNISKEKKVLFFGSTHLYEKRKGMPELVQSLDFFKKHFYEKLNQQVILLVAGRADEELFKQLPLEYIYLGFLKTTKSLAEAYQAADIFLCPTIQDAGPLMISESLMCGTPVVSFKMGIASEVVIDNETGFLASNMRPEDFALGINTLLTLSDKEKEKMNQSCREIAIAKHSYKSQINKYIEILKQT